MTIFRCLGSTSAARSFVQIASRGFAVSAAPSPVRLDFLVPRAAGTLLAARTTNASAGHAGRKTLAMPRNVGSSLQQSQMRGFAASARRHATRLALNPKKDDDGNDMMLEITPRAAQRLSEIMRKDDNPNLALRIQVESGGCHGFQYLMNLVTIPGKGAQEWSSVVAEDDSIFRYYPDDADPDSDPQDGPRIILDEPSLELLKGSKVDFTKELIGSQFKIVDNPYATSSCGCGTSFDIKM